MTFDLNECLPIGYGLMSFTWIPSRKFTQEQFNTALKTVLDQSKASSDTPLFLNGGEFYGIPYRHENIEKLGQFFVSFPEYADKVYVSIKGGVKDTWEALTTDDNLEKAVRDTNRCLTPLYKARQVKPKCLDMFTLSRTGDEPIEDVIACLNKLKRNDELTDICLSECSPSTLQRALKIGQIKAVEIEFSLAYREVLENGLLKMCSDNGVAAVCYSPLGKGLFVGLKPKDITADDVRSKYDRFTIPEVVDHNNYIVEVINKLSEKHKISKPQLCCSWIAKLSNQPGYPLMIPIPGSVDPEKQLQCMDLVDLSPELMAEIDADITSFKPRGHRYNQAIDVECNR